MTGWADYGADGILAYREALAAVVLRRPCFPAVAITHIWVDHPVSIAGGRALWSIPKVAGRFSGVPDSGAEVADAEGLPIAGFRFAPGPALPWRQRVALHTVQTALDAQADMDAGAPVSARMRARGRLRFGRAAWTFAPDGPLAFLQGRRPWLSACLEGAELDFGV